MTMWRFLRPSHLGFTYRTLSQAAVDKVRGAPSRPVQVASYVAEHARPGDPQDVLRTIDRFATEERWLMCVGPQKRPLIEELGQRLPTDARILELGAYCGYSAILMASVVGPQAQITSLEIDAAAAESSRSIIEAAGLSDRISVLHGASTEMIPTLDGRFDLVFMDHWKDLYKPDLQLIERHGLIGPGSIVVADNVGEAFDPADYLHHVRTCGNYTTEHRPTTIEYTSLPDAVEISLYQGVA